MESLSPRRQGSEDVPTAGSDWSAPDFAAKMHGARERLALLSAPARSLEPGSYRAYLAPSAMEEIAGMLCWGGFSGRALATRQSCLFRMQDGEAAARSFGDFHREHCRWRGASVSGRGLRTPTDRPADRGRTHGRVAGQSAHREGVSRYQPTAPIRRRCQKRSTWLRANCPRPDALAALDTGLYVGNLWYLNFSDRPACRITGMTRFASFWVEHGRIVAPVNVMRFDDSVFRLLGESADRARRPRRELMREQLTATANAT